jgi:hypothetical protein
LTRIVKITPRNREAWFRERGKDVTASTVACLFGEHPFITPFELWALKTKRLKRSSDEGPAMQRGRLLEPVAVQLLRETYPKWKIEHNAAEDVYYRDPAARLGGTPDVIVTRSPRGRGVVQIKSVEASIYRRNWLVDGEPEAPLWIALQASLEAYLTGAEWAAVAPLVIGHGLDLPLIDIPLVPGVIEAMKKRTAEFWAMVEEDREPTPDYARDGAVLDRIYSREEDEEEVDLTADDEVIHLIRARAGLQEQARIAKDEIAAIDAAIKARMGRAAVAHLPGGRRITWRTQKRSGSFVAPTEGRVLRFPKEL